MKFRTSHIAYIFVAAVVTVAVGQVALATQSKPKDWHPCWHPTPSVQVLSEVETPKKPFKCPTPSPSASPSVSPTPSPSVTPSPSPSVEPTPMVLPGVGGSGKSHK